MGHVTLINVVLSVDHTIVIAMAAKGNASMLIIGLAISIPLVIFAATLLLKLMEKWSLIIAIGAGLIG